MRRRTFLSSLGVAPALLAAQQGPPREERVESLTPARTPTIALNHLGFLPKARKVVVVRAAGEAAPAEFAVRDIGSPPQPFRLTLPLKKVSSDLGDCLVGDFSELEREAMYQLTVGQERSAPFFIRKDVWRRTLPKAENYIHAQRCGVEAPNVHPVCHLDDARRRDTGQHVDVTGGWHDAGDLRKWMSATMLDGFALLELARNLGEGWDPAGSGLAPLLDEMRWGNRYFLKMQDTDGRVWNDTAGGVNGDNSDNHWTDNKIGTSDDRYINPGKSGRVQAMFTTLEAMVAQAFREADAGYSKTCLGAALRCWEGSQRGSSAGDLAWWTRAALELYRAIARQDWAAQAAALAGKLLALQNTEFTGGQKAVRGFWRAGPSAPTPYADAVHSAEPPLALLELAAAFPDHPDAGRWRAAVRLHLDEYVLPMSARSAYRIMPFGLFFGSPTPEYYRPLAGELTYRYFMPVRRQFWWLGMTSHLECYALLLARAAGAFSESGYRDLACRQLEWVMGANPFGACLMTGEGMRNPYPHSRYVGLIPGGIMNGIAGNTRDEPILDTEYGFDWRTTEYWSPHNAYYLWAVSALEAG
jgi:hypothetical protein